MVDGEQRQRRKRQRSGIGSFRIGAVSSSGTMWKRQSRRLGRIRISRRQANELSKLSEEGVLGREQNVQIRWSENVQDCEHREIGGRSKCGADKGAQSKPLQGLLCQIVYFVDYFIQVSPLNACLCTCFVRGFHLPSLFELAKVERVVPKCSSVTVLLNFPLCLIVFALYITMPFH